MAYYEQAVLEQLRDNLSRMWVIDTHEHLVTEDDWLQIPSESLDFTHFFSHYASVDIISSGCPIEVWTKINSPMTPLVEKWTLFEPHWDKTKYTGYCHAVRMAIRDLYDLPDLSRDTYEELSVRMREVHHRGWYQKVLKDRAKIEKCILNTPVMAPDPEFFAPVAYLDNFIMAVSHDDLAMCEKQSGISIHCAADLDRAAQRVLNSAIKNGAIGTKIAVAYMRTLHFDSPSLEEAEKSFDAVFANGGYGGDPRNHAPREARAMQDYMVQRIIRITVDLELPVQFHTGMQEGNGNHLKNSNPLLLTDTFLRYPNGRFDIFHAGYPFTREVGVLAKMFPGVYADMCWMHIISPAAAREILSEWIETVPTSKIFAFGGDYLFVEGTYAHSMMARENVARVLAAKVAEGYLREDEASRVAKMILHDNAEEFFNLKNMTSCGLTYVASV